MTLLCRLEPSKQEKERSRQEETMNRGKAVVTVLAALALVAMALGVAPRTSRAEQGHWADVCCGPSCPGGDYCLGTGTYTCCKS